MFSKSSDIVDWASQLTLRSSLLLVPESSSPSRSSRTRCL